MIEEMLAHIAFLDAIGAAVGALVAIILMSLVPEPARQGYNAILVAGAAAVYMNNGGFGAWEYIFTFVASLTVFLGLYNYRFIALAWVMHSGWDFLHHYWGNPILPILENSSFGCMIFDFCIAIWFWRGAPTLLPSFRRHA